MRPNTVANHVVDEGATARSPSHFLEAIVIHQQENSPGSPQRYMVIDGQQRLTTLQLLLNAAARTAGDDLKCAAVGELLRRPVYTQDHHADRRYGTHLVTAAELVRRTPRHRLRGDP